MSTITVVSSGVLPITNGYINVDTSAGPITLFVNAAVNHDITQKLIITKVSNDHNPVSLLAENCLISGAEIILFGLPIYAKVKKGKIRSITLKGDGKNWHIIHEENI